ncbi:HAD family acid phosphatase [Aquicella lusitana]|uniref:Acid phosphatase n=1 Tax=Aquicella lusitana TaxID=254246 RepID=A0A370GCF8_9COXI|nr:HAD family acid phosphatase [Aquicella lusitana]RDI41505.1 acid phosphatase [Aquicella lusitana]VVC72601.1 hypothetical protein AQULUS_03140 [Aquicella lusitana]
MKKILPLALVLSVSFGSMIAMAKEPTNLAVVKQGLVRYHDSGQYDKDIDHVIKEATRYLKIRLAQPRDDKKPAIVLDIDETSLSNYPDMVKLNFGGTLEEIQQAEDQGSDPVIQPTLKLYQFAKANKVAVFFITGRKEEERAVTEANLKKAGYTDWNGLILRDGEYKNKPAAEYKTVMRKKLEEEGYDIVLNIGDQRSDLEGGYADKTFKLPNPYYFIP